MCFPDFFLTGGNPVNTTTNKEMLKGKAIHQSTGICSPFYDNFFPYLHSRTRLQVTAAHAMQNREGFGGSSGLCAPHNW